MRPSFKDGWRCGFRRLQKRSRRGGRDGRDGFWGEIWLTFMGKELIAGSFVLLDGSCFLLHSPSCRKISHNSRRRPLLIPPEASTNPEDSRFIAPPMELQPRRDHRLLRAGPAGFGSPYLEALRRSSSLRFALPLRRSPSLSAMTPTALRASSAP